MEDKNNNPCNGGSKPSAKVTNDAFLDEKQALELQDFFEDVIPPAIETPFDNTLNETETFSQLFASSISQGIDDFYKRKVLSTDNSSNKALQASSLIGRSVLVEEGRFYLEEAGSATGWLCIDNKVLHVLVYVENEQQEIVRIIPLGDDISGEISFTWNGVTRTGERAPEGDYRFIVSSIANSRVQAQKVYTYSKIIRVTFEDEALDMRLHFDNEGSMKLDEVIEIIK